MASPRDKYRNPPAPPGYVCERKPALKLKDDLIEIDGVLCQFIKPMIEIGLFDHRVDEFAKFLINSDSEDEVLEVPVPPKVTPLIEIDVDEEEVKPIPVVQEQKTAVLPVPAVSTSQAKQNIASSDELTTRKSQNNEVQIRTSPVDIGRHHREASPKRKPSRKEKHGGCTSDGSVHSDYSRSKSNKHEGSSKKKALQKEKFEGYCSDGSVRSYHSTSPVRRNKHKKHKNKSTSQEKSQEKIFKQEKHINRSTSRERSPERIIKRESSSKTKTSKKDKYEGYGSDGSLHSGYSRRKSTSRERSLERISKQKISSKRKTSKKDKYDGNSSGSDGNVHSDDSRRKAPEEVKRRSRTRSRSVEDKKMNVKQDPDDGNLFGRYHCSLCNATMNSEATYHTHIKGKRHIKNLKQKNVADTVQKTFQNPVQVDSRYPPPPSGVYRTKVREPSLIQYILERDLLSPCPGLENVIEIQGMVETTYFCELCSAPCSSATIVPHLQGYRHQLRCLKHFDYARYETVRDRKKGDVEKNVERWLREIERKRGRGMMSVEREFTDDHCGSSSLGIKRERMRREDMPGPSYRDPEDCFPERYDQTTIPDTTKSDFYCKICDSHMNSMNMWEMHVRGKRHLANVKKAPGELPSKSKTVLVPNARARIMDLIDTVPEPVVGLDKMREVQNPEAGELYNCFLCGACLTEKDIVDHILSLKHRKKYLEDIDHPEMATLKDMNMVDSSLYSIIDEICYNVECTRGRGVMEVHRVKSAVGTVRTW